MKQILQNLKDGTTELVDVPTPTAVTGNLLIQSSISLISAGTERMLIDFGKAGLIDKARQQPDKVKMVIDKIKTDGLLPTIQTVRNKLDQPVPLGYCNVGTVIEVGKGVEGFEIGYRVASNGYHAEFVRVPKNLCVRIPDSVTDEYAAFTVIGAIALQGIRLINPTMGEAVVVTGLGLIGLMAVQLLRAQGCRVLGIDYDPEKISFAKQFGAECVDLSKQEDPVSAAEAFSRGRGVDAVLITASTKSNEPVSQAAKMCRKRGRIVLVGVTGLELSRADFFKKELSFQVSCSYGPGRYDSEYEEKGHDYPIGYVRWTEQRNMEAILDMMASGALNMQPLISHRYPIDKALQAYDLLSKNEPSLGILLEYPEDSDKSSNSSVVLKSSVAKATDEVTVGFIGAGNYAGNVLMPAFKDAGAKLKTVVSSGGVTGVHFGKKYGFETASTEVSQIINDKEINTVVVATRHNTHARFIIDCIKARKHVFAEKPLCLSIGELDEISTVYENALESGKVPLVMIGFNRRFSPHIEQIKSLLSGVKEAKSFVMTVNAGAIPADHWTQDPEIGGGRIVGEACHFIDLLRFLVDSQIENYHVAYMGQQSGMTITSDKASITLSFANGSIGTIHYFANGDKSFPKERLEVFCAGRVLQLDNFRKLTGFGWPGFKKMNLSRQDKGQANCVKAFVESIKNGRAAPIPINEIIEVARVSIELAKV